MRDLGVTFDSELTMQRHVNTVIRACSHHIQRLKQIRRLLGKDVAAGLVSAFILSRLDYCNAVLAGLPKSTIAPLQRVQNAAARLVARLGPRDHVTSTIRDLHWLPVQRYRLLNVLCHYRSTFARDLRDVKVYKCKKNLKSLKQRSTATRPTSHN